MKFFEVSKLRKIICICFENYKFTLFFFKILFLEIYLKLLFWINFKFIIRASVKHFEDPTWTLHYLNYLNFRKILKNLKVSINKIVDFLATKNFKRLFKNLKIFKTFKPSSKLNLWLHTLLNFQLYKPL